MKLFADILIIVVALESLFIMLLEMFGTQTKLARNVFNLKQKYLLQKETRISMANQGLYNGFLGVSILLIRYYSPTNIIFPGLMLFIGFIVIAAIFGSLTANKKIIFSQGLPSILTLIVVFLAYR
ncbi:hypothetical protein ATX62_05055 [Oenococcus oeni]|uniref:DUF1304 domain-containing protein n=1 Tax=Oenococcus oeni TaxID=1247 RepID=UPI0008F8B626|nr:DUF1304 domain-containing protein [Oenococcus oeni]OIM24903.1 hypothetical protein ATX62_05055 [Oenococcus oeni]SYW08705.1 conserved membrane hypothetical protein [Oenococcus oeni]SYW20374.1 conserved membrane hypothetical protein [Oenococcus oeni]